MEKNLKWLGVAAVVAALAGCSTMEKMGDKMSGGSGGERVTLSGSNEVPPVSTSATGSGTVMVASDKSVKVDLKVSGMKPTAAHIHMGAAGANGPVIVPLEKKGESEFVSKSDAKMTEEQYAAYKAGRTYVNVHSDQHKGGEIRAQLKGQ
jgi:hypothetical protein